MKDRFETFVSSITDLNRYIQKIKELEMRRFGLKAQHTMCLYYLGCYGEGLTATQLTELCREDKAAISRCLRQLIEKRLVQRHHAKNKRAYRTIHTLTEQGRALVDKVKSRVEAALKNGGGSLSDAQRESFYASMGAILKNLSQYVEEQESKA